MNKRFLPFIVLTILLFTPFTSFAEDNCYINLNEVPDLDRTGHDIWPAVCDQPLINQFWYDFNMGGSGNNWDSGFGYRAPCDAYLPLGRTFAALYELTQLKDSETQQIGGRYEFAKQRIQKLVARCSKNGSGLAWRRSTVFADAPEDQVRLFMPFFYGTAVFNELSSSSVLRQAGVIVHEARHAGETKLHTTCKNRAFNIVENTLDENYLPYQGAFYYEVNTLWDFVLDPRISPVMKAATGYQINNLLADRFCEDPGFALPPTAYCPHGFHGRGGRCDECPAGKIANETQTACVDCPAGTIADQSTDTCKPCKPNEIVSPAYLPDHCQACDRSQNLVPNERRDSCVSCDLHQIPDLTGGICISCPRDSIVLNGKCESCRQLGLFGYFVPSKYRESCVQCPPNKITDPSGTSCIFPYSISMPTWLSPSMKANPMPPAAPKFKSTTDTVKSKPLVPSSKRKTTTTQESSVETVTPVK